MGITRRDFLKYTAVTAAVLGSGTGLKSIMAMGSKPRLLTSYTLTNCEMCYWKCGVTAKVVDGKVVKLDGNPLHPNSRGKLCARGNAGIGLLYDEDRLKSPLISVGKRGEGKFRKASWEEALSYIAEKMETIKKNYGPESVALFAHGSSGQYFGRLIHAFGSPNVAQPSFAQCRGPRDVGYELTFGENPGGPERVDMGKSKAVVLFGTHLGENMHNSQVQDFAEALGNRAKLIVIDPRYSLAAGKADYWLPIRPGSDMALMLAWINILITENLYDKEYIDSYSAGFKELAVHVAQYTPEWAEKETEIPASLIAETVRELGKNKPAVCVHPGRHATWYGNDVQRSRCLALITALLGAWGREGGIFLATNASLPEFEEKEYPEPAKESLIALCPYPFAGAEGVTNVIRDATISGKPYPVKGWIVVGTNLLKAMPDQKATMNAINQLDLIVSVDVMPYDTAMVSDVVLPECTYLERFDDITVSRGRSLGLEIRRTVVKPMYESRDGYTIARELSKKLNLADYFPWATVEEKIKARCGVWNIDYNELSAKGFISMPGSAAPYISPDNQPVFNTASGKIELYSSELKNKGFDPLPIYSPVDQPKEGSFRLLYGRSPVHTFCRTTNNKILTELFRENEVWINAGKARSLGLRSGDYVVLQNQDGVKSHRIKVKATQRIREDCVYMVHGFCSESKELGRAYHKGASDQGLITKYAVDPICGSTGMRVNFVTVAREV